MKKILMLLIIFILPMTKVDADSYLLVNDLKEGSYEISGNTYPYTEIIVKDQADEELAKFVSDKNGEFFANLSRQIEPGEIIDFYRASDDIVDEGLEKIKSIKIELGSIGDLEHKAYIEGYAGEFRPDGYLSRAEAVTILARLIRPDRDYSKTDITRFIDASEKWYSEEINYLDGKGLIDGYDDGKFYPDKYITRAEIAKMLGIYLKEDKGRDSFYDVKDSFAKNYIGGLYDRNIINGYPDGSFKPDNKISRAEAVKIFNRAFDRKCSEKSFVNIGEIKNPYKDLSRDNFFYYEILEASFDHNSYHKSPDDLLEVWTKIYEK